jgi:hypothetical protein
MADNVAQITVSVKNLTAEAFQSITADLNRLSGQASATGQQTAEAMAKAGAASKDAKDSASGLFSTFQSGAQGPVQTLRSQLGGLVDQELGKAAAAMGMTKSEAVGLAVGLGVTVGAAVAVGAALVSATNATVDIGAELHRMSLMTGISVEGLSKLRYASTVLGDDLTSVGGAMFQLQRRMSSNPPEFQAGLKAIGLTLDQLQALSPDQQLIAISDAMRTAGNQTEIAAAAFGLFGRQGRELLPMLLEDLHELTDESDRVGSTWTKGQADMAESVEHAEGRIKAAWERMKVKAGETILPALAAMLQMATGTTDPNEKSAGIAAALTQGSLSSGSPFAASWEEGDAFFNSFKAQLLKSLTTGGPSGNIGAAFGQSPLPVPDTEKATAALRAFDQEVSQGLEPAVRNAALAIFGKGGSLSDAMEALRVGGFAPSQRALSDLYDGFKKTQEASKNAADEAAAASKKQADALALIQGAQQGLTDAERLQVDADHAAGASAGEIAVAHNLNRIAVENETKAYDAQTKAGQESVKAQIKATSQLIEDVSTRGEKTQEANDRLFEIQQEYDGKAKELWLSGTALQLQQLQIQEDAEIARIRNTKDADEASKAAAIERVRNFFAQQRQIIAAGYGDWISYFSQLEAASQTLASSQNASVAGIGTALVSVTSGFKLALQSSAKIGTDFKILQSGVGDTDKAAIQFGLDIAAAAANAVASFSQISDSASRASNTLHGAMGGVEAGSAFGPWGMLVGGIIGGLVGLFHSAADEMKATQADLDKFTSSQGGIDKLTASVEKFGLTMDYVNTMIATKPGITMMTQELAEDQKIMDAATASGKAFGDMVSGWATPITAAATQLADLKSQLAKVTSAADYAAISKQIADLQASMTSGAADSQAEFSRLMDEAQASMAAMLQTGSTLTDVLTTMGPAFKTLVDMQGAYNFALDTGDKKLLDFYGAVTKNADVVQYLSGLAGFITGIGGSMGITSAMASDWGAQLQGVMTKLTAGGTSHEDALLMMQGALQAAWEQSTKQILPLEGPLKDLVDEALKQGIIGENQKSVAEQQLDALVDIKNAVIGLVQEWQQMHGGSGGGGGGGGGQQQSFGWTSPAYQANSFYGSSWYGSGYTGLTNGAMGLGGGIDYESLVAHRNKFASGSDGFRDFGRGTPAVLHGVEAVMRPMDLASVVRAASGAAAGGNGVVPVNVTLQVDRQVLGRIAFDLTAEELLSARLRN